MRDIVDMVFDLFDMFDKSPKATSQYMAKEVVKQVGRQAEDVGAKVARGVCSKLPLPHPRLISLL